MAAVAAILDFQSVRFELFFFFFFFFLINKSSRCFLPSFKLIGLSVQEKNRKIHFQEGGYDGQLGFSIETIITTFDLPVTPMLPTKFQVNWSFGSGEEAKNRISKWP